MSEKTNTLNKSTSIICDVGYAEFEIEELDRFFREKYPYDAASLMFDDLRPEQYPNLVGRTKKGIRSAIDCYLQKKGVEDTIYHTDLYDLVCENPFKAGIQEELRDLDDIDDYADDVSQRYSMFLYNQSAERFCKVFNESLVD
jgi:hypothetical protein